MVKRELGTRGLVPAAAQDGSLLIHHITFRVVYTTRRLMEIHHLIDFRNGQLESVRSFFIYSKH